MREQRISGVISDYFPLTPGVIYVSKAPEDDFAHLSSEARKEFDSTLRELNRWRQSSLAAPFSLGYDPEAGFAGA